MSQTEASTNNCKKGQRDDLANGFWSLCRTPRATDQGPQPSPFTKPFVGGITFNYYARLGRQETKRGTTNVAATSGRCIVSKQSGTDGNINIGPEYIRNLVPVSRYHGNRLTVRGSLSCGRIGSPASLWKFGTMSEEKGEDRRKKRIGNNRQRCTKRESKSSSDKDGSEVAKSAMLKRLHLDESFCEGIRDAL
ncbi:Uncharacterized protein DBV15_00566 [Temnothorax longispinosus]|uniref:Uncharacterized protein n=1 Tax=Temnothorax longispinosus TaxID=300112 RepID=A0A4S2KSP1_9HYME|nr:Uncharacterized protein DBV15_00566 [Temnothorax longispinosus]